MTVNPSTKTALDCEALIQLIPEYAFGLTDDGETSLVETNLDRCPEAQALLADYRALQADLRASVPLVDPSPELGARLRAAVHAAAASESVVTEPITPATPAPEPALRVVPPQRKSRRFYAAWITAAAALIGLVITNAYWFSRVNGLSDRIDSLTASGSAFVLTDTSALHWVRLASATEDGNASAFMMWNNDSQTGLLYARGFPEPAPGFGYQLWLATDAGRISGGVFEVDQTGDGALLIHIDTPIDSYTRAGITTEPVSGSAGPTSPAVVRGDL